MPEVTLILSNGIIENYESMKTRLLNLQNPFVIAVDGGYRHADPLNLDIDIIIGDLDSTDHESLIHLQDRNTRFERFPADKDEIDLELALLFAITEGAVRIIVLGALGGRVDMTAANLLLLGHSQFSGNRIEIWQSNQTAWYIDPPGDRIDGEIGDSISLIPIGGDVNGITTEGLAYPLQDETLLFGKPRGISNVMTHTVARIEFSAGGLLVVHTAGRA